MTIISGMRMISKRGEADGKLKIPEIPVVSCSDKYLKKPFG